MYERLIIDIAGVLAFMAVVMAAGWVWQRHTGNGGWIDVSWTFGTGICGVLVALLTGSGARAWLLAAMVALWSLRLGTYIAIRVAKGGKEDVRYSRIKAEWGAAYQGRMFLFMQIQGPITALLCLAIGLAALRPGGFGAADLVGMVILLTSIAGEALADRQMAAFRSDQANKGSVCDTGLWGRSRHPNYFFEWLGWCAWPVMALQTASSWWLLSLLGPVAMYLLLRFGTGVPPLEATMIESRGDLFRAYQARVPVLIPFPPPKRRIPLSPASAS